jgi:hypothetical protein
MVTARWKGPDVLVIGWIPFHLAPPVVVGYAPGPASSLLFWSGNPNPPIAFRGYSGFANWLYPDFPVGSQEYRAALYVKGVAAIFYDDGSLPRADYTDDWTYPGYTPYRLVVPGSNVARRVPGLPRYGAGYGPYSPPVSVPDPAGNWVELCYRAEFKLSRLPNLLSRVISKAWAPYAWCEIFYRFDKCENIRIRVEGSAIPSRCLYIDWQIPGANPPGIVPEYDMLTATQASVTGFLQTVGWGCQPAPGFAPSQLAWSGQGTAW